MSIQLASVEDQKAYMNNTYQDQDAALELFLKMVSAEIETYLGRELTSEARTRNFDGGKYLYYLPAFPIDTGKDVTVTVNGTTMTENEDYYVDASAGLIEFKHTVPGRFGNPGILGATHRDSTNARPHNSVAPGVVEITWTGGYTKGDKGVLAVPDDIKFACIMQTNYIFKNRDLVGRTSVTMPDGTINNSQTSGLIREVRQKLFKHKVIKIRA